MWRHILIICAPVPVPLMLSIVVEMGAGMSRIVPPVMGAIIIRHGAARYRIGAPFSWQFHDYNACQRLCWIIRSTEGGELGADLDGGGDDIRNGVRVGIIRSEDGFHRIIRIGVIGF